MNFLDFYLTLIHQFNKSGIQGDFGPIQSASVWYWFRKENNNSLYLEFVINGFLEWYWRWFKTNPVWFVFDLFLVFRKNFPSYVAPNICALFYDLLIVFVILNEPWGQLKYEIKYQILKLKPDKISQNIFQSPKKLEYKISIIVSGLEKISRNN